MEPNQDNVIIVKLNRQQKKRKKRNLLQQKKRQQERKRFFFNTVSPLLGHLIVKKNHSTVSAIGGHFCIRFSREEEAATVSTIPGPFYLLLRLLPCPGYLPVLCHLYLALFVAVVAENFFLTLCHLYLPQFMQKKKPGQHQKKNLTSSRRLLPVKLSKILANITELANPLKKIWQTRQLISKKTKSKTKKMMGLQRFLLYKLFLSSRCDRKLENSGKDFKWRGDRKETARNEPDECLWGGRRSGS